MRDKCDCELRDRKWNPFSQKCMTCGARYEDPLEPSPVLAAPSVHNMAAVEEPDDIPDKDLVELELAELHELSRGKCFCSGFRCTKHLSDQRLSDLRPKVVVLCGSSRFQERFDQANYEETLKGHIVLSTGGARFTCGDPAETSEKVYTPSQKAAADDLHKRKIDLADEVFVLNVGGYVGKSTAGEIEYAEMCGKPIRWLESPADICATCKLTIDPSKEAAVTTQMQDGSIIVRHHDCAAEPKAIR